MTCVILWNWKVTSLEYNVCKHVISVNNVVYAIAMASWT